LQASIERNIPDDLALSRCDHRNKLGHLATHLSRYDKLTYHEQRC
jgi:hypothetical protein